MTKRILSLVMALAMVLSMVPAFAAETTCVVEDGRCTSAEANNTYELIVHPTVEGFHAKKCTVCKNLVKDSGHEIKNVWTVVGTKHTYACEECGLVAEEVADHDWQIKAMGVAPNCGLGQNGSEDLVVCSMCGAKQEGKEGDVITVAHKPEIKTVVIEPTCTTDGKWEISCSVCGQVTGYEKIDHTQEFIAHSMVKVGYTKDANGKEMKPTCVKLGSEDWKCSECGTVLTKELKKVAHTWAQYYVNDLNAALDSKVDCTKDVYSFIACEVCEERFDDSYVVETAKGAHSLQVKGTVEGTCVSAAGYVWYCTNAYCDYEFIGDVNGNKVIDGTNTIYHRVNGGQIPVVEVPATCYAPGYRAYYCPTCGVMIEREKNAAGQELGNWVTAKAATVLPQLTHSNKSDLEADRTAANGWTKVAATCQELAYWESTCVHCKGNYKKIEDIKSVKAHVYVDGDFVTDISKVECDAGNIVYVEQICKVCGAKEVDQFGKIVTKGIELKHKWVQNGAAVVEPNCGETGYGFVKCAYCGKTDAQVLPTVGKHEYAYKYIDATCNEDAEFGYYCVKCGEAKEGTVTVEPNTALNHNWSVGEKISACGQANFIVKQTCARCGEVRYMDAAMANELTEADLIAAQGHKWSDGDKNIFWVTIGDCLTDGIRLDGICTVCGLEKDDSDFVFVKAAHVVDDTKESKKNYATCTGTYDIYTCKVCKQAIVEKVGTAKNAENHEALAYEVLVAADCQNDGFGIPYCTACEFKGTAAVVIEGEHKWTKEPVAVVAPTCGKAGYGKYECTVCGVESDLEEIKATGKHTFAVSVKNSGRCNLYSFVVYACSECGAAASTEKELEAMNKLGYEKYKPVNFTYYDEATKTLKTVYLPTSVETIKNEGGHNYGEATYREATCEYAAGYRKTCKNCGYEENVTTVGTKLAHDEVTTTVKATCFVDGYTKTVCYVCGAVIEEKVLEHTGHDMKVDAKDARTVKATCSTTGVDVYKCANKCGYEELIVTAYAPANHVWETVLELRAMDCAKGITGIAQQKCAYCSIAPQVRTIPVKHTLNDGVVVKEPTCVLEGLKKQTCTVCEKYTVETAIETLEHVLVDTYVPASCKSDEGIATKCSECDLVVSFVKTGAKKFEHKFGTKTFVPADCKNNGHYVVECSLCGETVKKDILNDLNQVAYPALNHKGAKEIDKVDATCMTAAYKVMSCPLCKEEYKVTVGYPALDAHDWKITNEYNNKVTCATPGYVDRECTLCGAKQTKRFHTPVCDVETVISAEAIYEMCTVCGKISKVLWVSPSFTGYNGCVAVKVENGVKTLVGSHKGLVVKAGKEATCTEKGQIEHIECTVCGTILQQGAEIPAHTVTEIAAVEATCTTAGSTAGKYCEVCKKYIVEVKTVEALGHKEVEVPAVPATATTAGTTAGKKCSVCNEILEGCQPVAKLGATVKRLCVVRSKAADYREDATSEVVKMLAEGTAVVITGELVNEYYPVEGGYIHMSYITVA